MAGEVLGKTLTFSCIFLFQFRKLPQQLFISDSFTCIPGYHFFDDSDQLRGKRFILLFSYGDGVCEMMLKYFLAVGLLLVEGLLDEHVEDGHAQTEDLCFLGAHGGEVAQRGGSLDGGGAFGRPVVFSEGIELLFLVDADLREMGGGLDNSFPFFDKIAFLCLI